MNMAGKLYLVATPIGNLDDFSPRAVKTLKDADVIAAEDTRNSIKLLNRFDIHTPMVAYHDHNRYEEAEVLIRRILNGENVALITDAGTPGISDPGEEMVRLAREEGVEVISIPGPAALINGLILSGLPTRRFRFEGFLPREKKDRAKILTEIAEDPATIIFYEAPHHLRKTLEDLKDAFGDRRISICRELTKIHEEVLAMTIREAISYYETNEPKGEFVLVVEGMPEEQKARAEAEKWENLTIEEHLEYYISQGVDKKEAMKRVALERKIPKREVYKATVKK